MSFRDADSVGRYCNLDTSKESSHTAGRRRLLGGRGQTSGFVAADGSGRADGSRHQRSFGSGSRLPKTDLVRPELRAYRRGPKNGINLSQTNAKTSQHQRLRPATKMRTTLRT